MVPKMCRAVVDQAKRKFCAIFDSFLDVIP